MPEPKLPNESTVLAAGGIAALLVGACCVGPLLFASVGLGGAWLSNLVALEPYRPLFIGVAALCLALAWRRIYRPAAECKPGEVCAIPKVRSAYKAGFWVVSVVLIVMLVFPYFGPLFY